MNSAQVLFPTSVSVMHIGLTLLLFIANILLTLFMQPFAERLKFVGHEMVYLSTGIVATGLLVADNDSDRLFLLMTVVLLVVLWLINILITKRTLDYSGDRLSPLVSVTILLGGATLYLALGGYLANWVKGAILALSA